MTPAEIIVAITVAIVGSGAFGAFLTGLFNRRKTAVETNHTVVDTSRDALAMYKESADARCAALEKSVLELTAKVEELEHYRAEDNHTIVKLNQLLGQVMRGAEEQGRQMNIMRDHIGELLEILRRHDIALPDWAASH